VRSPKIRKAIKHSRRRGHAQESVAYHIDCDDKHDGTVRYQDRCEQDRQDQYHGDIILSRTELSWAFPILSLSYVITVLISPLLLHETFSPQRLMGTLVICLGVFLVSRTY
jgi:hypothetical protein